MVFKRCIKAPTRVLYVNSGNFHGLLRVPVIESGSPNKTRLPGA